MFLVVSSLGSPAISHGTMKSLTILRHLQLAIRCIPASCYAYAEHIIAQEYEELNKLLAGATSKSDWAAIRRCPLIIITLEMTLLTLMLLVFRDSTSVSESSGSLASNASLDFLRNSTEPV